MEAEHAAGRLSYAQVLMLLRVIQPETARIWVWWAVTRTCKALQRAVEDAELYHRPRACGSGKAAVRRGRQPPNRPARATCARRRRKPLRWAMPWPEGEPFEVDLSTMSLGVALPPTTPHGRPHIVGFDLEATGAPAPEALAGRIRFWCPRDMLVFIRTGLATYDVPGQVPLAGHERLERLVIDFLLGYLEDPEVQRVIATYPALERDGWECQAPICSGVGQVITSSMCTGWGRSGCGAGRRMISDGRSGGGRRAGRRSSASRMGCASISRRRPGLGLRPAPARGRLRRGRSRPLTARVRPDQRGGRRFPASRVARFQDEANSLR